MNELQLLIAGVLEDLDGAGALADCLSEAGREREAVLLRRRWKAWKTHRAKCVADDAFREKWAEVLIPHTAILKKWPAIIPAGMPTEPAANLAMAMANGLDDQFRDYIRARFLGTYTVLTVKRWAKHYGVSHVVGYERDDTLLRSLCGRWLFSPGEVTTVFGTRICRKCRKALASLPGVNTGGAAGV